MKAISAVIATIMLLMITVSLIGVFYVFSSTLAGTTTGSGSQQASQLTAQLSMCMQIDNIFGNQVTLRNCGKGVIENKSLVVMVDDVVLGASANAIQEGNSSVVNVSGLWQIQFGKHNLKISNGAAVAQSLVDVQPNKNGLVGSWNFDEGSGNKANDDSGNGNIGTLLPSGSEPTWVSGKFNKGLQFDGVNDYVDAGNGASLNFGVGSFTIIAWINTSDISGEIVSKAGADGNYRAGYTMYISSGALMARISDSVGFWGIISANDGVAINNNQLHMVSIVRNGSKLTRYVDGAPYGSITSVSSNSVSNSFRFSIGKLDYSGLENWYGGIMDEVRIWNRALAPDDTVVMKQII